MPSNKCVSPKTCPDCHGRGEIRVWLVFLRQCWRCAGEGKVWKMTLSKLWAILDARGPLSVTEIAAALGVSVADTGNELARLLELGLVSFSPDSKRWQAQ